ncbi:MAG: MFS transporter [Candidatus Heimdallarchaeota archaeon]|nr:MFS transporter [Candidatus Heimdallarchaeota archaeon]
MSEKKENRGFLALILALFIDLMGFSLILPVLIFIEDIVDTSAFSTPDIAYGWVIATYSIAQFIFSPLWGRLSDSIGRRPVILTGVLGSSITFIWLAFAPDIFSIIASRALQGFFTAATLPTARAYIADTTPVEERAKKFGFLGAAFGMGFTLGPIIGGLLGELRIGSLTALAAPALFAAFLSLINFIMAYKNLDESLPEDIRGTSDAKQQGMADAFSKLIKFFAYPGVGLLIIIFGLYNLTFSGFETLFGLYLADVDPNINADDPAQIGMLFGLVGIVAIIIQVKFVGPVSKKIGDDKMLVMSLAFLSVGYLLYGITFNLLTVMLVTIPVAIGSAFFSPAINSSISSRIPKTEQGGGLGLSSSLGSLGRIFGPLLFTGIYRFDGDSLPFILSAGMITVLLVITFLRVLPNPANKSVD